MHLQQFIVDYMYGKQLINVYINCECLSFPVITREQCRDVVLNDDYTKFLNSTVEKINTYPDDCAINIFISFKE